MKKTILIVIMLLFIISLVSAFVTDDIDSYIEQTNIQKTLTILPLAIKGPGLVPPSSTNTYYLLLDTRTECYGDYATQVTWDLTDPQNNIQFINSNVLQPSPSRLISGIYYSKLDLTFPSKTGSYTLVASSVCRGSGYEKIDAEVIFIEVASKCIPQCMVGEERCRDQFTKQVCQSSSGCSVWGTISTCPSNQICEDSQCKVRDACVLNTRRCISDNSFEVCIRTSFGDEYKGEHFCPSVVGPKYKYCTDGECVQCRSSGDCSLEEECVESYCRTKETCDKTLVNCGDYGICVNGVQNRICTNECGDPSSEEKKCDSDLPDPEPEVCDDLSDNDLDGAIDCADTDCSKVERCKFCTTDLTQNCQDGTKITTFRCVNGESQRTSEKCKDVKFPLFTVIMIFVVAIGVIWFIIWKNKKK